MDVLETLSKLEKITKRQEKDIADLQIKFEDLKLLHVSNFEAQLKPFEDIQKQLQDKHTQLQDKHTQLQDNCTKSQDAQKQLQKQIDEIKKKPVPVLAKLAPKDKNMNEFEELKKLLHSNKWPPAVDPSLICDITSEQDKQDRAEGILDLIIDVHLENLKFLDFGCGEGHVVMKALEQSPQFSIGFDIEKFDKWSEWPKKEKALLTTDWKEVEKNKPYNVVLIFDVLDHMSGSDEEIITKLKEIKSLMAPNAKIYIRCHPWCSVHGTHLYKQINKAWTHLVFEDHELEEMGYKNESVRKVTLPIATYDNWFKKTGLKIDVGPNSLKKQVNPFFNQNLLAKRIKNRWKESGDQVLRDGKAMPHSPMELEFVDYILK